MAGVHSHAGARERENGRWMQEGTSPQMDEGRATQGVRAKESI